MSKTIFDQVAEINTLFGNPKGDYKNISVEKLTSQCKNILDEYTELLHSIQRGDLEEIRDALCDIQVFVQGAQHMMGVDGDLDMIAVIDGLKTRFIKDENDLMATMSYHKSRGIHKFYFEGEYPMKIMKSAEDQPDAPKGKFLKSVSYSKPIFPKIS